MGRLDFKAFELNDGSKRPTSSQSKGKKGRLRDNEKG